MPLPFVPYGGFAGAAVETPVIPASACNLLMHEVVTGEEELSRATHIVVCTDLATGHTIYLGPFDTADQAREEIRSSASILDRGTTYSVAPLFPA